MISTKFNPRRVFVTLSFVAMAIVAQLACVGCGRKKPDTTSLEPVSSRDQPNRLGWLRYRPELVRPALYSGLSTGLTADPGMARIALGFGLERPQKMDLGVYGKIGTSTVFVAPRKAIADYDRLYWVMVRVLSEKYGCFIRRKVSSERIVRFDCRDRRTIVLERDISGDFAKFTGRQFDENGREIVIKPRSVAVAR